MEMLTCLQLEMSKTAAVLHNTLIDGGHLIFHRKLSQICLTDVSLENNWCYESKHKTVF